jgi:hypothetical protein
VVRLWRRGARLRLLEETFAALEKD